MNIVLPIFFAAVGFGLFVKRMTAYHWAALGAWIAFNILLRLVKHS